MIDAVNDKPPMRKTGRPPKAAGHRKDSFIGFRSRTGDVSRVDAMQRLAGFKSRSEFVRSRVLADEQDSDSPTVTIIRTDYETLRLLKSCANNLNQQARKFNALGIPPSRADHGAVLDFLRQFIAEQQKRLLT